MVEPLAWLFGCGAVVWLAIGLRNLVDIRLTERLEPLAESPAEGPLVSILVPARNEASRILERSVRSLLDQTWPSLQVIAVDDRSTDETGAILHRLAAEDPRLAVVDGVEPPPGWLGKNHALHQALGRAEGEWVLATDADMLFEPSAVATAMTIARERGIDLVTLIPQDCSGPSAARLVMPLAAWMFLVLFPPRATGNPRDPRALGCGGFLLVRRALLEAAGGYAAIRDDVADDVATATLVKRQGGRLLCGMGPRLAATPMYNSLRELWHGFSKNALRGVGGRLDLALGAAAALLVGGVLPAAVVPVAGALAIGDRAWLPLLAAAGAAYAAQVLAFVPIFRRYGAPGWQALSVPFGFGFMAAVVLNSAWSAGRGRGIEWRGRTLPPGRRAGGGL